MKRVKSALISVFHKDGLSEIVRELDRLGVEIYSTGGTEEFILAQDVTPHNIEELTGYPSILGGRVKTLHPKVFGGILARRSLESDLKQLAEYQIPEIDLVIVDLYPFEETVKSGGTEDEIIEKIDIGGISLIRAAAKNFQDTTIVASREQYGELLELLKNQQGTTSLEQRRRFAAQAFNISSHYDTAIFNYFNLSAEISAFKKSYQSATSLRYGENPHQRATFFGDFEAMFKKLGGKDISYNNLLDIDAAVDLISEFSEFPTFAILKHNNACGVAQRDTLRQAWEAALAGDPISAFGGVLISNKEIDTETAQEINKLFFEVIIAPSYQTQALEILKTKEKRIILEQLSGKDYNSQFRSILNGVSMQERDQKIGGMDSPITVVTKRTPTESEIKELLFANKIVKHTKSNAIVLVRDGQLLASGMGQTSRVDALRQAIEKAKSFSFSLKGAVMASDAFFPFPDCAEIAHEQGITSIIQPGGSINDQKTIDYCNANQMAMVTTSLRHFKH